MTNTASSLFSPLTLPNGTVVSNRLCKAAMEENLAEPGQKPGKHLQNLYRAWAEGGIGIILTGNVMIAPNALTGPGGVVLEKETDLAPFKAWAEASKSESGHVWMQINHPGRQVYAAMGEQAVSASDLGVDIPGYSKMFAKPRALTEAEIQDIITRFADTASQAETAGFTGVQIHAAHGYLLSQFLSPLTNKRDDDWGGPLENRAKLLLEVVKAVRGRVAAGFCVSVKLNSADFQKGGFEAEDAKWVVQKLNDMAVDLVELSGGSYESPAMQGRTQEGSTARREAYFIDFARDIAAVAKMPIMVTGGIKRLDVAHEALEQDAAGFGVSMLGVARASAFDPHFARHWKDGAHTDISIPELDWKNKTLASLATMSVTKAQLHRLANGKPVKPNVSPILALITDRLRINKLTKRYRKWRS